ncbi:MAG TPA: prohibitin family protein [Chloroflexi bacterium]|nr:prohibitin family protein [Chloroflexota bacterium]
MQITILISALAAFSWLVVVGFLALAVLRARQGKKTRGSVTGIIVAVIAGLLLSTVSAGLVFVQPQERGVVISALAEGGYRKDILQPGLRWVIPYAENVKTYPISKSTYTMSIAQLEGEIQGDDSIAARTADGQEVYIDASIIFSLNPTEVLNVHIVWQDRYLDGLIRPTVRGVIRDAVSQFRVNEVYSTKRDQLKTQIEDVMRESMEDNGLILSDFVLRNITFTDEYAASIEQKQIAEQLAQQAEYIVEQRFQEAEQARQVAEGTKDAAILAAEGRAESAVIEAKAEAEALQLIAEVLAANPQLLNYRYIEKLAPGIQVMLVPNDNPYILPLPDITP